jgi:hypothetical protein
MNTLAAEEKEDFTPPKSPPDTLRKVKARLATPDPYHGMSHMEVVQENLKKLRQEIKEQMYRDRMKPYLGPNDW